MTPTWLALHNDAVPPELELVRADQVVRLSPTTMGRTVVSLANGGVIHTFQTRARILEALGFRPDEVAELESAARVVTP
jgi:hypothetical protein